MHGYLMNPPISMWMFLPSWNLTIFCKKHVFLASARYHKTYVISNDLLLKYLVPGFSSRVVFCVAVGGACLSISCLLSVCYVFVSWICASFVCDLLLIQLLEPEVCVTTRIHDCVSNTQVNFHGHLNPHWMNNYLKEFARNPSWWVYRRACVDIWWIQSQY